MGVTAGFPDNVRVGTSSWSSDDWVGPFYPKGTPAGAYLTCYAGHFDTVEIDSTFYRAPRAAMVDGWLAKTPDDFVFSAKVPRSITHEKALVDCGGGMRDFVEVMDRLGDKLGPLLLQFEYVAKGKDPDEYRTGRQFLKRLAAFLPELPAAHRYVVEVRNEHWLGPELFDLLKSHRVALALTDYFTMPPVQALVERIDLSAMDLIYVRFLGHHRRMDELVKQKVASGERKTEWGELAVDRSREMDAWVPALQDMARRKLPTYIYFNNHYAGYAPGSIELFRRVWTGKNS